MLVSCFALWGLLNNMTDNLVPAFQRIFAMDQSKAALVQVAFYGAYAVLALFASVLVGEFSYRIGVLVGLGVYILGALLYIPACILQSFDFYFIGIFIVAAGCSILETTCNPCMLSLGSPETAVRRLNFAQAVNPIGSITGIFIAQKLILANLNPATVEERVNMPAEQLQSIVHTELAWICVPYVGLCAIAALIWTYFLRTKSLEDSTSQTPLRTRLGRVVWAAVAAILPMAALNIAFPEMDKLTWVLCGLIGPFAYMVIIPDYRTTLFWLLKNARYIGGVIAQFCYVGVQIAVWTWMNVYCQKELGIPPADAASYYILSIICFIVCCWSATWLMKWIKPWKIMATFSMCAILCALGTIYLPTNDLFSVFGMRFTTNVVCLVAMSGFMSIMFPTIYGIALSGMEPRRFKLGAAGLIMAILGGANVTSWMSNIIASKECWLFKLLPYASFVWDENLRTSSGALRASFYVPAICFTVVLAYALIFRGGKKPQA
jgi:FHS family L-fucose permease-like MFS transporter